jgi:membrane fusion protein, multidrug efflux system
VQQYTGTVASDQAQVDNAKLNIDYCHIIAPVSGRVGLRQVDAGNYVQTGDTNGIVIITQLKPMSVVFTVPEDDLPAILKRVAGHATLPAVASDRTGTIKLAEGKLDTIDNQVDTSTGTVKLRALFPNDDEVLFPSQFVNVQLQVDVLHDTTVVPTAAIQRGAPGTFVYLANSDSTVKIQKVKLGPIDGERVAIISGLQSGQSVVVDGADKLKDGAKVAVHTTPAGGAGTSTPSAADSDDDTPAVNSTPGTGEAPGTPGATPTTPSGSDASQQNGGRRRRQNPQQP